MRIVTHFVYPPIPIRSMDWAAWDDSTYGGDPSDKIGRGATEAEATEDLLDQIESREPDTAPVSPPATR